MGLPIVPYPGLLGTMSRGWAPMGPVKRGKKCRTVKSHILSNRIG